MAYDKVVDSTQLNADLTSVANAIRTKSGGSSQLQFPSGFVSEIGNISSGLNIFPYAYNCDQLFRNAALPETMTLDFSGNTALTTLATMFFNTTGLKNLTIKNLTSSKTNLAMNSFAYISNDLETLTLENCSLAPSTLESFCRSCPKLKTINWEIDLTNIANANGVAFWFQTSPLIENFRIKANTLSYNVSNAWGYSQSLWSADSFVSLANGLDGSATGKTFTFHANQKTYMQSLMGTNDNGTFVADAQGTLSLADFITSVKGWTIA